MWRHQAAGEHPSQQAHGAGTASRQAPRALIEVVCESPITLKHTMARIRQEGHDVSLVIRVHEASARRDLVAPDLVLLDARSHLFDGAQLCSQLGGSGSEDAADVLVVLDPGQKDFRSRFISLGAADCVASGDDPEEIGLRIQVLLSRRARGVHTRVEPDDEPSPLVCAICDYLTRHLSKPVGMEDLEERFGKTRKQLNQEFELHLGFTVFAWYRRRKMEYACELLATSTLGVEEIARILGYASVCNFSTAFRQYHGTSPRAYRQSRRSPASTLSAGRWSVSGHRARVAPVRSSAAEASP